MALGNRGLGRGLDALLGGVQAQTETVDPAEIKEISLDNIIPNQFQPRREFDQDALNDLAASIKSQGVLQPILVRPNENGYELIAGERRFRASRLAGRDTIPVLVREMTDQQSLAIALIENLQREDLNPIEEALGYRQLQKEFGLSQEELAKQVGKSRSALANALRLLKLPEGIQKNIQNGVISAGHGRALMAVSEETAGELQDRIVEQGLTVRQAEAMASHWKEHGTLPEDNAEQASPAKESKTTESGQGQLPVEDAVLSQVRELLVQATGLGVKAGGSIDKGKITFAYGNKEQLAKLLEQLGLEQGIL
ncbi:MAG: ParB/RepB/Spo0J family partition protein [Desulfovibrio sp.]